MNGYNLFIIISLTFTFLVSVAALLLSVLYNKTNLSNYSKDVNINGNLTVDGNENVTNDMNVGGNLRSGDVTAKEGTFESLTVNNNTVFKNNVLLSNSAFNWTGSSGEQFTVGNSDTGFTHIVYDADTNIFAVQNNTTFSVDNTSSFNATDAVSLILPRGADTSACERQSVRYNNVTGKLQYCGNSNTWVTLVDA